MNKYFKNFSMLVENDLEQAKLVIAAQDVLDRLQKIAEHLAELGAEEIMPLSDNMKAAFGADIATGFEKTADEAIQKALESVRGARDVIDTAITRVQGNMDGVPNDISAPNDMADNTGIDDMAIDGSTGIEDDNTVGNDLNLDAENQETDDSILSNTDSFGGAEASDNALGRMKKESTTNKDSLTESFRDYGKQILMTESIGSLVSWVVDDAKNKLTPVKFQKFREAVQANVDKDPVATAGWIALKKKTVSAKAQESKPTVAPSAKDEFVLESLTTIERKARGVAKVIEANIIAYGSGKAAQVVNQFTSTDLNESSTKNLIEEFKKIYGMSPASYSVKLKKEMTEDVTTSTISPTDAPTPSGTSDDLTNDQKSKALTGIGDIASTIADNPGNGNRPVASVTSTLPQDQQQAINTVKDKIADTTGKDPETVNDLLKDAPEIVGEEEKPNFKSEEDLIASHSDETLRAFIKKNEDEGKGNRRFVKKVKAALEARK